MPGFRLFPVTARRATRDVARIRDVRPAGGAGSVDWWAGRRRMAVETVGTGTVRLETVLFSGSGPPATVPRGYSRHGLVTSSFLP